MIKPLLTAKKAGTLLGVSESFCRKCYGELGGFLIGGKIRFTEESIQNALQNKIRTVDGTGAGQQCEAVPAQVQNETRGRSLGGGKAAKVGTPGGVRGRYIPPRKNHLHAITAFHAHFLFQKLSPLNLWLHSRLIGGHYEFQNNTRSKDGA